MLKMDYTKIFVSSLLVILFYYLFGRESIEKLMQHELALIHTENEPKIIKAPGCKRRKSFQNVKIHF